MMPYERGIEIGHYIGVVGIASFITFLFMKYVLKGRKIALLLFPALLITLNIDRKSLSQRSSVLNEDGQKLKNNILELAKNPNSVDDAPSSCGAFTPYYQLLVKQQNNHNQLAEKLDTAITDIDMEGMFSSIHNLTNQKKLEAALEKIPTALALLDDQEKMVAANQAELADLMQNYSVGDDDYAKGFQWGLKKSFEESKTTFHDCIKLVRLNKEFLNIATDFFTFLSSISDLYWLENEDLIFVHDEHVSQFNTFVFDIQYTSTEIEDLTNIISDKREKGLEFLGKLQ